VKRGVDLSKERIRFYEEPKTAYNEACPDCAHSIVMHGTSGCLAYTGKPNKKGRRYRHDECPCKNVYKGDYS
jgi:hypothetical protein